MIHNELPDSPRVRRAVALYLEQVARAGQPAPSNRQLADAVEATMQLVKCAMNQLRKKRLVRCVNRGKWRRIYVKSAEAWTAWNTSQPVEVEALRRGPTIPVNENALKYDAEGIAEAMKGRRFTSGGFREITRAGPKSPHSLSDRSETGCSLRS